MRFFDSAAHLGYGLGWDGSRTITAATSGHWHGFGARWWSLAGMLAVLAWAIGSGRCYLARFIRRSAGMDRGKFWWILYRRSGSGDQFMQHFAVFMGLWLSSVD